MDRKIDFVFDSNTAGGESKFQLASGHISETFISFEKEGIFALIFAKGEVQFLNEKGEILAVAKLSAIDSGRGVYMDVTCKISGNNIILEFPIYQWIDHYPNCDGEHDRWDTKTVGKHTLMFDGNKAFLQ